MSARVKIFRWKALGPLLLFFALFSVLWVTFADTIARRAAQSSLSELLGTEVDIGSVRIRAIDAAVDVGKLAIADPRDPTRDLFQAGAITIDLAGRPILEKKVVIDQLRLSGLRFMAPRTTPARPAKKNSAAGSLLKETEQWASEKFHFPTLALGKYDSLKGLALKPDQLASVKAAKAFASQADSTQKAFQQSFAELKVQPLVDSSTALVDRLSKADPRKLGIAGTQSAVTDVQKAIDGIKKVRTQLASLEQSAKTSLGGLQHGLADVEAARQRDYAFARSLMQLPSFDAPNIGASMFGGVSVSYFRQALYYGKLVQKYVPPGLQPWNRPGPTRMRMSGTTVEFPKLAGYPRFLLKQGEVDLATGTGAADKFKASVAGITSQPALYGRPATIVASGRLAGDSPLDVDLSALSRHFGKSPLDSVAARVKGIELPMISIPGMPFSVDPGKGTVGLAFSLSGDKLAGTWEVSSSKVSWISDSAQLKSASLVERTVWQVVTGLNELKVRAELGGTIDAPTLKVNSNLDDAVAARLKGLATEALAKGEARARQAVDSLVDKQIAQLRTQVDGMSSQLTSKLPVERGKLDGAQKQLEAELKKLAGGALGGFKLP